MRKLLILVLVCSPILLSWKSIVGYPPQKKIEGVYKNDGTIIMLTDSSLIVLSSQQDCDGPIMSWRHSDTIAICSWTWISDSFIRIDSPSCYELVRDSAVIEKEPESCVSKDSVLLSFAIPVHLIPIIIRLLPERGHEEIIIHYPSKKNVMVPNCPFYVFINTPYCPADKIEPPFFGQIEPPYSKSYFAYPFLLLNYKNDNGGHKLNINIPCMDESFFEKSWIIGEYIQITEKGLIWHGDLFYYQKDKKGDRFPLINNHVIMDAYSRIKK